MVHTSCHHRLPLRCHTTGYHQAYAAHAGLLDDMPDGSEMRKLQDLEEHVGAQGATVKKIKQQNAKARLTAV